MHANAQHESRLATRRQPIDIAALLDPELVAPLTALAGVARPLSSATLPDVRASMRAAATSAPLSELVERVDHRLIASDGHQFLVRVHRGRTATGLQPAVVWLHGGGLVAGTRLRED